MIVTKSWLNEWINLDHVGVDELAKTFNSIGLEVDRYERFMVPEKVVIGKVLECAKHPDADKLNVCKVDIGTAVRQIVCGAANVRAGLYVAVATIGAHMPGGLVIKPVQLRGVDSEGMICSSTEIGLPKIEDGIMELDESIGSLVLGTPLSENIYFNDDLIEIELTANRGDCLSINGICRDLSAAFRVGFRERMTLKNEDKSKGIGRILHLIHDEDIDAQLKYCALEIDALKLPLLMQLRLAQIDEKKKSAIESLLFYATYCSGVVLRAYNKETFESVNNVHQLHVKRNEEGFAAVYGTKIASIIGVKQQDDSKFTHASGTLIAEASYIAPDTISRLMHESECTSDELYYRTSRGTDNDLEFGMNFLFNLIESCSDATFYSGMLEYQHECKERIVSASMKQINALIGNDINKSVIVTILKSLGFGMEKSSGDDFVIKIPHYRHDILNKQDIVEEIVRLIGIDNIVSKPFVFAESNRFNSDYERYKKRQFYRNKAAYGGFFESVHFVFNERAKLEKFGFTCIDTRLELLNPIAATLDTLRPTLLINLLESASLNAKSGRKNIALFEVGSVFSQSRHESLKMGFVVSGAKEIDSLSNAGKPHSVDFAFVVRKIASVIGEVTLRFSATSHTLSHTYQCASLLQNGRVVGELFKLHPSVQDAYDLGDTFMCEIDFEALEYVLKKATEYSKFQASYRDLSVLMPHTLTYESVANVIGENCSEEIVRFYPVDRYRDEKLGENVSMTLRFVLQSNEKTLEEEDITKAMSSVLGALENDLGLGLR
jgi:phenylalanyl-tRNA synthetase beta chain